MAGATAHTDARLITGEELALLPDVGPCELVNGRIVPTSPTYGWGFHSYDARGTRRLRARCG
jgi:hypothetical protein